MENRDKNIFCPPAKIMIPKNMRDKSCYCVHHEDFGHLTNDCRNLYGQIMFTIKRGGLQQYVMKDGGTLRMAEQPRLNTMQKGKACSRAENTNGRVTIKNGSNDSRSCYSQCRRG